MPIYAYKCSSCGYAQDALQKISDAPLTVCPHCGAHEFHKQVTAAGFQLKGSGWDATDFKGGPAPKPAATEGETGKAADAPKEAGVSVAKTEPAATSSTPAGGCGASCACH